MHPFFSWFLPQNQPLALDLGSRFSRALLPQSNALVMEPTALLVNEMNGDVLCQGEEALPFIEREPLGSRLIRPIQRGELAHDQWLKVWLQFLAQRLQQKQTLPSNTRFSLHLTSQDLNESRGENENFFLPLWKEVIRDAGFSRIHWHSYGRALALGAGYNENEKHGCVIVHLGAEHSFFTLVQQQQVIAQHSFAWGGYNLIHALQDALQQQIQVEVGFGEAEKLLQSLGSTWRELKRKHPISQKVAGRDLTTGLPVHKVVTAGEARQALEQQVQMLTRELTIWLSELPAESLPDVVKQGLWLTGGTSQLTGLVDRWQQELELPVKHIPEPETVLIRGLGLLTGKDYVKRS